MKVNLSIELDFINEDETLEEAFSQEVKKSIINRIESMIIDTYKPMIDEAIKSKIDTVASDIIDGYLLKPVVISNGYKQESYESVVAMVEHKFTSLYDEKIRNKNGCNKDPIMQKIEETIRFQVANMIDKMQSTLKREGAKIAQSEIEKSNLSKALEEITKR